MCSPSPPPPPDYAGAATAQGVANKEAALASSRLNNPNVVNPYGTQTWTEGATDDARPTMTQTLSPEQQALYDQSVQTKQQLGQLGTQGATALQGIVGKQFDLSGAPAAPGNAQATRDSVINAMMSRVNEDYDSQSDQANSDLIAAGHRPGSKGYDAKMALIDRGRNDARQQAIIAGGAEAQRDFGMDTQARKDSIAELLAQRNVPLNEITALMSGSQVSNPFAVPGASQSSNIQPAPVFNAAMQKSGYDTDVWNAERASSNAMTSGLFQLGAMGAMAMSDRRLKSNIKRIGTHPLGIGIYEYDIFGERDVGVMADEVMAVKPEAIARHPSGFLMVNYGVL